MKRLVFAGCVFLLVSLCVAAAVKRAVTPPSPANFSSNAAPMGKLVIHEWGTFTGFAGSDGVHLPFNTIVDSDLPGFVMNRQKFAARLNPGLKNRLFLKGGGAAALVRMETPVIYFYADAPGDVRVRVDFPQGLLTEFYPPVQSMGPRYGRSVGEIPELAPLPVETNGDPANRPASADQPLPSFLDWGTVRIVPHPTGDDRVPAVTNKSHYEFARQTDAALVQLNDADGVRHDEKFLFYRGLGNFSLPVTLLARGSDRFELRNAGKSPIPTAFLIEIDGADHDAVRFARFENVAGNQALALPATKATPSDLADAIRNSLVAAGLYEKEARAMVETWKANWLGEPGTRLLYIVPRTVTDALLPLHVAPTPDETVRVLVGRIDILTPERESHLQSMMMAASPTANLSNDDVRILEERGRFLDPALLRISKLAGDVDYRQYSILQAALERALENLHPTVQK